MEGYARENTLSSAWLDRMPLFLRMVQMQELMHYAQYLDGQMRRFKPDCAIKSALSKRIFPYLGFFDDSVYSPKTPFRLALGA